MADRREGLAEGTYIGMVLFMITWMKDCYDGALATVH